MKTEKVFFSEHGIFICTKCQKSIPAATSNQNMGTDIAEFIKNKYKPEFNQLGHKGKVRIMTSSCLGVCPTGFQAISQISMTNPQESKSYVFDPFTETEQVFDTIKKSLVK